MLCGLAAGVWLLLTLVTLAHAQAGAGATADEAPLVIGQRTVFVFRAALGAFTPADRAASARQRILQAFDEPGEGWTSVKPQAPGLMVELDGKPLFLVLPDDLPRSAQAGSVDAAANTASRLLQTAWREARERRDPRASMGAVLRVLLAAALLAVAWLLVWRVSRRVRDAIATRLSAGVQALPDPALATRISPIVLSIASRLSVLVAWLVSLVLLFLAMAYSLDQFVLTRAMGEGLFKAFASLLLQGLGATAAAVPGLFVAITIFLLAWIGTQVSAEVFKQVAAGRMRLGLLDAHTAPVTRHIVNASLWLFAAAMAYPYLPGAQTEAFKGLTVILGLMVSIGASGLIGQVASGVILVYTRALSLGDHVRIQDCEGTVTEIGLFVTRLRTGLGAEYALPNAVVVGNVTRNLSRETAGRGCVLETGITIGYDTPWRQVHALLTEAARTVPEVLREPVPYVVQTALSDHYVAYRLLCCVGSQDPAVRARVPSDLQAAILDQFNRHGVQIMSPHYVKDPALPKIVPESAWFAAPAARPDRG